MNILHLLPPPAHLLSLRASMATALGEERLTRDGDEAGSLPGVVRLHAGGCVGDGLGDHLGWGGEPASRHCKINPTG